MSKIFQIEFPFLSDIEFLEYFSEDELFVSVIGPLEQLEPDRSKRWLHFLDFGHRSHLVFVVPLTRDKAGKSRIAGNVDTQVSIEAMEPSIVDEPVSIQIDQTDQFLQNNLFRLIP